MKKIISIVLLGFIAFSSNAQAPFKQSATNASGIIVDAGSDTMSFTVSAGYFSVGIQPLTLKNSGTVAGTMTLSGTINGVDWFTIGSALTLTNAARNSTVWSISVPVYKTYRIITTGGTTMNISTSAVIYANR